MASSKKQLAADDEVMLDEDVGLLAEELACLDGFPPNCPPSGTFSSEPWRP